MGKWTVFVECPLCQTKLTAWKSALIIGDFVAEAEEKHWVFVGEIFCPHADLWAKVETEGKYA